jgi:hypothetical protein
MKEPKSSKQRRKELAPQPPDALTIRYNPQEHEPEGETGRPNWRLWTSVPHVELWQAVALSLDLDPDLIPSFSGWELRDHVGSPGLTAEFNLRLRILHAQCGPSWRKKPGPVTQKVNGDDELRDEIELLDFVVWGRALKWRMPRELTNLVKKQTPASNTEPARKQKEAPPDSALPPKSRKTPLRGSVDKALSATERNTLLTIMAALCHHAGIDPDKRGAAGQIVRMTEAIGAPISDDTALRWLRAVPDALETRMK